MGYFDHIPMIGDNDCVGNATTVRITFEAGHSDDRDRRAFAVVVYCDGQRHIEFDLHYDAAREFIRALQSDMRRDLREFTAANEEECGS